MSNLNQKKIILHNLINNSRLEIKDREVWDNFLLNISEEEIEPLFSSLSFNVDLIYFFNDILQAKQKAFQNNDFKFLEKIIQKEKNFFQNIDDNIKLYYNLNKLTN